MSTPRRSTGWLNASKRRGECPHSAHAKVRHYRNVRYFALRPTGQISCIRMEDNNFQARYASSILVTRSTQETPANSVETPSVSEAAAGPLPTRLPTQELRGLYVVALIFALTALLRPGNADAVSATRFCERRDLTPHQAINCTWPKRLRAAAKRVAECESTASAAPHTARRRGLGRWARNGTHLGIFQLGNPERSKHGPYRIGSPAVAQARAAYSLYRDRGWQPWECKP